MTESQHKKYWKLRYFFFAAWLVIIVSSIYTSFPNLVGKCEFANKMDPHDTKICTYSILLYISSLALILTLCGAAFTFAKNTKCSILKKSTILIISIPVIQTTFDLNRAHIENVNSYGYEIFLIILYLYLAFSFLIAITAALFTKEKLHIIFTHTLLSIITIPLLSYFGRGSEEHIISLIGGILDVVSFSAIKASLIFQLLYFIAKIIFAFAVLRIIFTWLWNGKTSLKPICDYLLIITLISFSFLLSLISIPIGKSFQKQDVEKAKNFIAEILPELEKHYVLEGEYPKTIFKVIQPNVELPKLLSEFEYKSETKGGFYLSNQFKYCFIVHNNGFEHGYHSITNERGWNFSHKGQDLAHSFLEICDEGGEDLHQALIAEHLGVPQNPYDEILYKMVGSDFRPALSLIASQDLHKELESLSDLNPKILDVKNTELAKLPIDSVEDLKLYLEFSPEFEKIQLLLQDNPKAFEAEWAKLMQDGDFQKLVEAMKKSFEKMTPEELEKYGITQ